MDVNQHLDLHALFSNKTPLEQIKTIIDLNSSALTDIFKGELLALLRDYWWWLAYKDAVKLSSKDIKEILR